MLTMNVFLLLADSCWVYPMGSTAPMKGSRQILLAEADWATLKSDKTAATATEFCK